MFLIFQWGAMRRLFYRLSGEGMIQPCEAGAEPERAFWTCHGYVIGGRVLHLSVLRWGNVATVGEQAWHGVLTS